MLLLPEAPVCALHIYLYLVNYKWEHRWLFVEIFNIIAYIHIHIHAHTQICVCVCLHYIPHVCHTHAWRFLKYVWHDNWIPGFHTCWVCVCVLCRWANSRESGRDVSNRHQAFELENSIGRESQAEHCSRGNSSWQGMPRVLDGSCGKVAWAEDETSLLSGREWCVLVRQGFTWRLWILEPGVKM